MLSSSMLPALYFRKRNFKIYYQAYSKSKGGLSADFTLAYVHSVHEQYVKLHEQHFLTYIQMIEFQMSQYSVQTTCPVLVHNPVQYDINTQFVMW